MARVLGRIRLSRVTDESTSVERQTEAITAWAKANGHEIVDWATDLDFSRSVKPFDAPNFGKWLNDPEKIAQWDIVVAYRVDRLGAGLKLSPLYQWCLDNDKDLICTTQPFNLRTPEGRIVATVLAEIAQGEWEATQERILNTRIFLRGEGRWPGGTPKYGFWPVRRGAGYKLIHDDETAPVVRRIVGEYLDGTPLETIAYRLNQDGILSPMDHYRTRKMRAAEAAGEEYVGTPPQGTKWGPTTISKIVRSKSLMGEVVHNGKTERDEEGNPITYSAEPLIDPAEYRRLQAEVARRAEGKTPRERNTGQLLDVAKCLECNGNLHHRTQRKKPTKNGKPGSIYRYYYCPNKHGQHIRAEDLEALVGGAFLMLLGERPRMRRIYIPAEEHTAELEAAESALEELTAAAEEAKSQRAKTTLRNQIRVLDARIAELEALPERPARTELQAIGSTYREEWERLDEVGRRNLLRESGITAPAKFSGRESQGRKVISAGHLELDVLVPEDIRERLNISTEGIPFGTKAFPSVEALQRVPWIQHMMIESGADPATLPPALSDEDMARIMKTLPN
jgi:DNA invertase Pin-like site-specific DNA recombinase